MDSNILITYIKSNVKYLTTDQSKRMLQIITRNSEHAVTDHSDGVRINLDDLSLDTLNQIKIFIENLLNTT